MHETAANNAVRAILGLFPLAIFCLKSWLHVLELNSKLAYSAYRDNYSSDTGFSNKFKLEKKIKWHKKSLPIKPNDSLYS